MPNSLIKDIQDFTKQLFLSGQSDLHSHEHETCEKDELENETGSTLINKFKLNVQTNAVCVDILVWATKDEQGKNNLLNGYLNIPDKNVYREVEIHFIHLPILHVGFNRMNFLTDSLLFIISEVIFCKWRFKHRKVFNYFPNFLSSGVRRFEER